MQYDFWYDQFKSAMLSEGYILGLQFISMTSRVCMELITYPTANCTYIYKYIDDISNKFNDS